MSDCVLSAVSMEPLSSSDLPPTLWQVAVRRSPHCREGAVHALDAVGGLVSVPQPCQGPGSKPIRGTTLEAKAEETETLRD